MASTSDNAQTTKPKLVRVVITKDNMSAMMAITNPAKYGHEVTLDEVREEMQRVGVVHGIDWKAVERTLDERIYDTPVKVAVGTPPQRGIDASFEYDFNPEQEHSPEESEDGRIDYRSINFIQNVQAGTVLVRKTPPTAGEDGIGVDGKIIPGIRGRDFPFSHGSNTRVSDDGLSLVADKSGAIVFARGVISVNDVTVIKGDVDMSVGNIECIGSVRVQGEVQAGFSLHVGGNLEVWGNVAEATIRCDGNVLIKGGCFGKGEGLIKAKGDVVVKYAEGQRIAAGGSVMVGEELLNCRVVAGDKVIVKSKRGKIIGGEINAGKQIQTAIAGTDAGTSTTLRVGYDLELIRQYHQVSEERARLTRDVERVKQTLYVLYREQMNGELPPAKADAVKQLEEFKASVPEALERLAKTKEALDERLKELADASIVASDTLYHGVVAHFGPVYREITDTQKRCSASLVDNRVILSEYKPQ